MKLEYDYDKVCEIVGNINIGDAVIIQNSRHDFDVRIAFWGGIQNYYGKPTAVCYKYWNDLSKQNNGDYTSKYSLDSHICNSGITVQKGSIVYKYEKWLELGRPIDWRNQDILDYNARLGEYKDLPEDKQHNW